jgi:hypothetical protein
MCTTYNGLQHIPIDLIIEEFAYLLKIGSWTL